MNDGPCAYEGKCLGPKADQGQAIVGYSNSMENPNDQTTYLVVDGENIDATLGLSVLDRRPNPEERPRWDRVLESAHGRWG